MFRKWMTGALAGLALFGLVGGITLFFSSPSSASIIYSVNRVVGAGTVVGFIETDGTLGILSSGNITNWSLTLTSFNLSFGSPDVIDFATQIQTNIGGTATSATPTQLLFDFTTAGNNFFLLQGSGPANFYCLETNGCTGSSGPLESFGSGLFGPNSIAAEFLVGTGILAFANVTTVPEPSTLLLFGVGLTGLAFVRRRKRKNEGLG